MTSIVQSNAAATVTGGNEDDKITSSQILSSVFSVEDMKVIENGISDIVCHNSSMLDMNEDSCTRNNTVMDTTAKYLVLSDQLDNGSETIDSSSVVPDAALSSAIVSQVEYYFSDANLPTDKFMQQQISRDKYGFVALSVIATFKKMKKLSTDTRVIACALSQSSKLEISKNGTRVRRTHSLTTDSDKLSRMVVAINLQEPTNDSVKQQFSVYGDIENISIICRGEFVTGADVRRQVRGGLDSFGKAATGIALIQYEKQDCAHLACEHLTDSTNWRYGLHVSMVILPRSNNKKQSAKYKDANSTDNQPTDATMESTCDDDSKKKRSKNPVHSRVGDLANEEVHSCIEQQCGENCRLISSNVRSVSPKFSPNASPKLVHRVAAGGDCHKYSSVLEETNVELGNGGSKGVNPWMQRRLKASQLNSDGVGSTVSIDSVANGLKKTNDIVSVIRQPKGPDGSKGFCLIRA